MVQPGDNLWSIAARALTSSTGTRPDDRAIAAYWLQVIDANRNRLPVPSDPDLIFTGDRIALPPPPAGVGP